MSVNQTYPRLFTNTLLASIATNSSQRLQIPSSIWALNMAGVKRTLGVMLGQDGAQTATVTQTQPSRSELHDASTRTPSPMAHPLSGEVPEFDQNASMVLAGIRGAGKSTLAVMASSAMKRKVVDVEVSFQAATGSASVVYKMKNGSKQCHKQQAKVLHQVLERNRTGCIIVCSWMERSAQNLLRDFAATNPVIHIVRDADAIQKHLNIQDKDKFRELLNVSSAIFRVCTNFEFFNVSEKRVESPSSSRMSVIQRSTAPYLALKNVEKHFLKFLSLIFPAGTIPFIESAFPLAGIPTEQRQFTYAVSIPLSEVLRENLIVEEHVAGADAVQIVIHDLDVDPSPASPASKTYINMVGDITRGIGVVRRSTLLPIIIHIFLPHEADEDTIRRYIDLIFHTLRLAPEMMTVDLRLDTSSIHLIRAARKRTKIIGNYYTVTDLQPWDSTTWKLWYNRAKELGCDMARLIRPAASMEDNFTINQLRSYVAALEQPKIPLIAYNSGSLGRTSAAFNRILTVVRPESLGEVIPRPPIKPCITAVGATKALFSSFMYDEMRIFVIGAQVDYSLSPAMHNAAFKACGIPHTYKMFSSESLRGVKHIIEDPNFGGASIGLPFKVEVITLTHSLSSHAQAIGAVNTLIPIRQLNPDGSVPTGAAFFHNVSRAGPIKALYGENTDWIGIRACIRRGLSPANAVVSSSCGLVIGAGGMARATVYAMLQIGIQNIAIYNRTAAHAEKVASHFAELLGKKDFKLLSAGNEARFRVIHSLVDDWPSEFRLPTVIISCIPTHKIGVVPAPNFTLPEAWLGSKTGGVVVELAYRTLDTPLLAQVRKESSRGWVTMDGLDLLPEQGFAQFELFTGRRAPRRVMRREVFRAYPEEEGKSNSAELQPRLQSIHEQDV
ncbi:hypothetical protein G7046_g5401 [Stylonectria norvegica]|nr:hypothetical protein G7046_g5401 [Stylonectria norvegica]